MKGKIPIPFENGIRFEMVEQRSQAKEVCYHHLRYLYVRFTGAFFVKQLSLSFQCNRPSPNHSQLWNVFNKSWYPSMCENALIFNVNQFNFSMTGCMLGLSCIKGLTLQDCDDCCSYNQQQFWCSMTKDALWQTWLKCSGIFGWNCRKH